MRHLRKITSIQRKPLQPVLQHVAHVAKGVLPDGQNIGDDPVHCGDRGRERGSGHAATTCPPPPAPWRQRKPPCRPM